MRKINALFFIFALFATPTAYAWDASALRDAWDVPTDYNKCQPMNILENTSIGANYETCKLGGPSDSEGYCKVGGNKYVRGVMMLVARDINENGAYFCPTVIGSDKKKGWEKLRRDWNRPYVTVYYAPKTVTSADCFWVCKPGYHGDKCQKTETTGCNADKILHDAYGGFRVTDDNINVESEVAMFEAGTNQRCANNVSPGEHDLILGVSEFLTGGHGVKAQVFVANAHFKDWNLGPGYIRVTPLGEPVLLCRSGYTVNFTNDDCVPVDEEVCLAYEVATGDNQCKEHDFGNFDTNTMEVHFFESSSTGDDNLIPVAPCWGFVCKQDGYGFDPSASRETCVDCGVSDVRNGIAKYGDCVRCDVGKIFDSTTGTCVTATAFSRENLYYGPGKNDATPIIEQCWTEPDMYSYSDCIWGNSESTGKLIRAVGTSIRLLSLPTGGNGGGSGGNGGGSGDAGGDNDNDSGGTGGGSNGLVVCDVMVPGPSGGNNLQTQSDLKPQITPY